MYCFSILFFFYSKTTTSTIANQKVIKNIDHDDSTVNHSSFPESAVRSDAVGNLIGADFSVGDLFSKRTNFSTSTTTTTNNNNKISKENLLEKVDALNKANNLISSHSHKSSKASLLNKLFYYSPTTTTASAAATTNNNNHDVDTNSDDLNLTSLRDYLNVIRRFNVYLFIK